MNLAAAGGAGSTSAVISTTLPNAYDYLAQLAKKPDELGRHLIASRHGQTGANLLDYVGGQIPPEAPVKTTLKDGTECEIRLDALTEKGRSQAATLGENLSKTKCPIGGYYSSTLVRALDSCRLVAKGITGASIEPICVKDIVEKHFGRLENGDLEAYNKARKIEDAETKDLTWGERFSYKPSDDSKVESLEEVARRASQGLDKLLSGHTEPSIPFVMCHNVVLKAVFMNACNRMGSEELPYRKFDLENCCVLVFRRNDSGTLEPVAASGIKFK